MASVRSAVRVAEQKEDPQEVREEDPSEEAEAMGWSRGRLWVPTYVEIQTFLGVSKGSIRVEESDRLDSAPRLHAVRLPLSCLARFGTVLQIARGAECQASRLVGRDAQTLSCLRGKHANPRRYCKRRGSRRESGE